MNKPLPFSVALLADVYLLQGSVSLTSTLRVLGFKYFIPVVTATVAAISYHTYSRHYDNLKVSVR